MKITHSSPAVIAKRNTDPEPENDPEENNKSYPEDRDDYVDYEVRYQPLSPEQRKAANWAHPTRRWDAQLIH